MKRLLLSIAILLFLAAGAVGAFLLGWSEKAIENSIIELSKLEPDAYDSSSEGKPAGNGTDTAKPTARADKKPINESKDNNSALATKNTDNSTTAAVAKNSVGGSASAKESDASVRESEEYLLGKAELAKDLKNKVTLSEKASLTKLLLSKLTKKDISELQGMLANGITEEEIKRAKEILYSRLSTEDIKIIKEAYIRYTEQ